MDKTTASAERMSEVSPLDEFFVTRGANYVNRIKNKKCYRDRGMTGALTHRDRDCMKAGIFGTKRTVLNRKVSVACGVNLSVNV